jgi:hypothetical protein
MAAFGFFVNRHALGSRVYGWRSPVTIMDVIVGIIIMALIIGIGFGIYYNRSR